MLAYVFWHARRAGANGTADYQRDAARFEVALTESDLEGFAGARTFAIDRLPWAEASGAPFEDWYLLRGSADLDELNDAAVSAARSAPHDRLAAGASWGSGGVYRVRAGDGRAAHEHASWFAKPSGMSYAALDALLAPLLASERVLWQRHMVLGSAPEFCLSSHDEIALPAALPSRTVRRALVAGTSRLRVAPLPHGLLMRERCMTCARPLPFGSDATICSYECTFCPECAAATGRVCPNCGGELVLRPKRSARSES